jgi:hypothetical protein
MTAVALWHLGVTALLAGVLGVVILVQAIAEVVRRRHPCSGRTVIARRTVITVAPRERTPARTVRAHPPARDESSRTVGPADGCR